ncbi:hypothetical protein H0H81_004349 [Sphagnurus paluster]|uniref:BRCT domain-containing protein n=1 Tax=Sphagnurus paluster TaxID=117069 RepID=A0A9P7KLE1_9AGAR|nr:hypothetical protein H0H81_004349 [Sphagnurus paluster]
MDPALADWFKIDHTETEEHVNPEPDSATDEDSDNADMDDEDADLDDWFSIKKPSIEEEDIETQGLSTINASEVKMGEDDTAMEYDQELIFKHLCFYLDSPENALKNGMSVKAKQPKQINTSMAELASKITMHGGRIVSIDEPKLTHIIIDKRDDSRRLELMKRTSKPKRRYLIVSEFIDACLEEQTLLDEEGERRILTQRNHEAETTST